MTFLSKMLATIGYALGSFETLGRAGDQRDAHMASTWVDAGILAGEKTAGQYRHIILAVKSQGELGVVNRCPCPQIETCIRSGNRQMRGNLRSDLLKLFKV